MPTNLKEIPDFDSEDEERAFWATHDSTEYIDWDTAEVVNFPKRSQRTPFHIHSPRLSQPQQAADFKKEVDERKA